MKATVNYLSVVWRNEIYYVNCAFSKISQNVKPESERLDKEEYLNLISGNIESNQLEDVFHPKMQKWNFRELQIYKTNKRQNILGFELVSSF